MFSSLSSMPKLLFAGFIALCLTSCLSTPGKGWKANSGYRAATPVIAALEKFHNDHSRYPTNLVELLPVYIPDAEAFLAIKTITPVSPYTPTWEKSADQKQKYTSPGEWFSYWPEKGGYSLSFRYYGPGVCTCSYNSLTKKWSAACHY